MDTERALRQRIKKLRIRNSAGMREGKLCPVREHGSGTMLVDFHRDGNGRIAVVSPPHRAGAPRWDHQAGAGSALIPILVARGHDGSRHFLRRAIEFHARAGGH